MLPSHQLSILRCPSCSGELDQKSDAQLRCPGCGVDYPVVDGIPVLLVQAEMDAVTHEISSWYDKNWQGRIGDTSAKKHHEDLSDLGQRYIRAGERRYLEEMSARSGDYFLDVGCGAQPRVDASGGHRYHVCLDLSLAGLRQCREILGLRGILVVGSATNPPLAAEFANTVLAAHSIYHINANLQPRALRQLYNLTMRGGVLNVFYFNPRSFEHFATWPVRALMRKLNRGKRREGAIYFHPLSISKMAEAIRGIVGAREWSLKSLRFFSINVSRPMFALPGLGRFAFVVFRILDKLPAVLNGYVVYSIRKPS